jgi:glycerophosphoryl diester phosphodiesterase
MILSAWMKNASLKGTDAVFRHWPQPLPDSNRLLRCRLISHRGEHDNRTVFENTVPAFEAAASAGVWGLELDVRWTRDLRPVVFHDRDTRRLFGLPDRISQLNFSDLQVSFPMIPSLATVVERFGQRVHLMIEIKEEPYPDPDCQGRVLDGILKHVQPVRDYHLISLSPHIFERFAASPPAVFLPIAELQVSRFSDLAIRKGYGGLLGHYLLISRRIARRHRECGQQVGTAYADSRNCLLREVRRGVDWIFSNRAAAMQAVIHTLLGRDPPAKATGGSQ